jgi:hypothetical protein
MEGLEGRRIMENMVRVIFIVEESWFDGGNIR